jgi:hypothetical protein
MAFLRYLWGKERVEAIADIERSGEVKIGEIFCQKRMSRLQDERQRDEKDKGSKSARVTRK